HRGSLRRTAATGRAARAARRLLRTLRPLLRRPARSPGPRSHLCRRRLRVAAAALPLRPRQGGTESRHLDGHGLRAAVRPPAGPLAALPGRRPGGAVLGVLLRTPARLCHAALPAPGGSTILPRRGRGEPALARSAGRVGAGPPWRRRLAV